MPVWRIISIRFERNCACRWTLEAKNGQEIGSKRNYSVGVHRRFEALCDHDQKQAKYAREARIEEIQSESQQIHRSQRKEVTVSPHSGATIWLAPQTGILKCQIQNEDTATSEPRFAERTTPRNCQKSCKPSKWVPSLFAATTARRPMATTRVAGFPDSKINRERELLSQAQTFHLSLAECCLP